ncbi:hypothetical protein P0Y35_08720 [Kiritimatiellaeota bacterium B1221]|nr:hypothetical protein [Kiritimatiellaeota bacterium B1221]
MAALTSERNSPESSGVHLQLTVKDGEIIYAGALVAIDANGEAVNASDAASLKVVGRCEETVDNSADGESVKVKRGCFWYDNGSSIDASDIGNTAFAKDNQTVISLLDSSEQIIAGIICAVDASLGVLVDTRAVHMNQDYFESRMGG